MEYESSSGPLSPGFSFVVHFPDTFRCFREGIHRQMPSAQRQVLLPQPNIHRWHASLQVGIYGVVRGNIRRQKRVSLFQQSENTAARQGTMSCACQSGRCELEGRRRRERGSEYGQRCATDPSGACAARSASISLHDTVAGRHFPQE